MSRIFFCVLILVLGKKLNGQVQVYLKSGVTATVSTIKRNSMVYGDTISKYRTPLIRPSFGFGLEKDFFNNKVKVMVGLELITRGYRDSKTEDLPGLPAGQISNMISIPVLMGYNINKNLSLLGGVTFGHTVWKNKNYYILNNQNELTSYFNSYSHGLNLGLEYNLQGFKLGVDYYQTLNSFLSVNSQDSPEASIKGFYRTGQIYVRYNFTTKAKE